MTTLKARLTSHLHEVWYGDAQPGFVLRVLTLMYRAVRNIRLKAYDLGLFKTTMLPVPVIVVGNITAGGTGKTPVVIALANALKILGWHPGIVSRGYGRQSRELIRVQKHSLPQDVGDEPLLIHHRTGVPTVVGASRVEAGTKLLDECKADIILCDDGLQHLQLGRQIEIAVVDAARNSRNPYLLPAGPFRDPVERVEALEFVLENGGSDPMKAFHLEPEQIMTLDGKPALVILEAVHAVAGIGHPERFFATLAFLGLEIIEHPFPDHHRFSNSDLEFGDDYPVVMTEKDAMKCRHLDVGSECYYLPVTAVLPTHFVSDLQTSLSALQEHV